MYRERSTDKANYYKCLPERQSKFAMKSRLALAWNNLKAVYQTKPSQVKFTFGESSEESRARGNSTASTLRRIYPSATRENYAKDTGYFVVRLGEQNTKEAVCANFSISFFR